VFRWPVAQITASGSPEYIAPKRSSQDNIKKAINNGVRGEYNKMIEELKSVY